MSKPRIAVVIGSTRAERFADKPAQWIADLVRQRGDAEVEVLDLRDYPMPMFGEAAGAGTPQEDAVQRWQAKVEEFDGFIFTAAEYNHGPTAVLKNAIDQAYKQWARRTAAFVGYGGVGGARAVEQLRLHVIETEMAAIRTGVHILWPDYMQIAQGKSVSELEHLNQSARDMLDQLVWWTNALKTARAA